MKITAEQLRNMSKICSGMAIKLAIDGATAEQISAEYGDVAHRIVDVEDPKVFDDKMPTIVTGLEKLSQTAMVCMLSNMDSLRFRNILVFPTRTWFEAEVCELAAWDRWDEISRKRIDDRLFVADLENY